MSEITQAGLFDYVEAVKARDAAIGRVAASVSDAWMRECLSAIGVLAKTGLGFTTDDLAKLVIVPDGVDRRVLGAAMLQAQHAGIITPTNEYRNSEQVSCHGRPKRVWRKA